MNNYQINNKMFTFMFALLHFLFFVVTTWEKEDIDFGLYAFSFSTCLEVRV